MTYPYIVTFAKGFCCKLSRKAQKSGLLTLTSMGKGLSGPFTKYILIEDAMK